MGTIQGQSARLVTIHKMTATLMLSGFSAAKFGKVGWLPNRVNDRSLSQRLADAKFELELFDRF